MRKPLFLILNVLFSYSLLLTSTSIANAQKWQHQTEKGPVVVEKIAGDLDTPWAMAMLPNGNLLVTLRDGKLVLVDRQNAKQISIKGTPRVWAQGQGGLLDVVLDPNFAENNLIYLSFSDPDSSGNAGTAIARARLVGADGVSPRLADYQKLYSMRKKTNRGQHFGSRIVPDKKGNLFFTIGDRGNRPRAQDPFDAAGKVMRIRTDGSIPANNPFADGKDALPEIWSIGHRNPQGATLNDLTGEIWTLAHGPKGGDEINIPQAGKNYGWPIISFGKHYSGGKVGVGNSAPGMEQPIYYWDPSIAPSGFDFYSGNTLPGWKGNLFAGALKYQTLVRLEVNGSQIIHEERLFQGEYGRVRDVRSFPDGALWFLVDDADGAVYRVTSAN